MKFYHGLPSADLFAKLVKLGGRMYFFVPQLDY